MTALDIACIVVAWVLVAFAAATVPGRLRHARPVQIPPPYPPPVPSSRHATDTDWLADQPTEVVPSEWDRRFFAIVDVETRWFA